MKHKRTTTDAEREHLQVARCPRCGDDKIGFRVAGFIRQFFCRHVICGEVWFIGNKKAVR